MHFELQTVSVEVLEEVNVNSSVDVDGDYFAIAVTSYIDTCGFGYCVKDFLESLTFRPLNAVKSAGVDEPLEKQSLR